MRLEAWTVKDLTLISNWNFASAEEISQVTQNKKQKAKEQAKKRASKQASKQGKDAICPKAADKSKKQKASKRARETLWITMFFL